MNRRRPNQVEPVNELSVPNPHALRQEFLEFLFERQKPGAVLRVLGLRRSC